MTTRAERLIIHSQKPNLPDAFVYTPDFGPHDKWSTFMRRSCAFFYETYPHLFDGKVWIEFGIGDGRNEASLLTIGAKPNRIIGVDKVDEKIKLARSNLQSTMYNFPPDRLELHHADAVDFLKEADKNQPFDGLGIMCLPQAPGIGTPADVYETDTTSPLARWDDYGLYLNAATLSHLSEVVTDDFRLIMILSGRVPRKTRERMIEETGWHIKKRVLTNNPILQDLDTPVEYVKPYDDGKRFFEKNGSGKFITTSAVIAAERVSLLQRMIKDGKIDIDTAKKYLNVYHHLRIYLLEKRKERPSTSTELFHG